MIDPIFLRNRKGKVYSIYTDELKRLEFDLDSSHPISSRLKLEISLYDASKKTDEFFFNSL